MPAGWGSELVAGAMARGGGRVAARSLVRAQREGQSHAGNGAQPLARDAQEGRSNGAARIPALVLAGALVLPGALVGAVRSQGELEALPLVEPEMLTPLVFACLGQARPSRAMQAAWALAADEQWLAQAAAHSGGLQG